MILPQFVCLEPKRLQNVMLQIRALFPAATFCP